MTIVTRSLHCTFCDDVRNEVGNKTTLVGVYPYGLDVVSPNGEPVILPRLCAVMTAQTASERPFKSLTFRLLRDDEVMQDLVVPPEALNATSANSDPGKSAAGIFGAVMIMQPFAIHGSGVLRVMAITESEELVTAGLRINFHAPASPRNPGD